MSFTIFQNEETPFQAIKTRSLKSPKIDIFPKGLTHGFGPKMAIFQPFLLRQYRQGKSLLRYSRTKKTPFYAIKTRGSKSRKIDIFPKGLTHGFWSKNGHFSTFFLAVQARKMSFTIFQHKKTPFQVIKTRSSKSLKIDIFSNGLTHGFGPKMAIFQPFLLRQYRPGKYLLRYSRTKKRLYRL